MFTGLVETVGQVLAREETSDGVRVEVSSPFLANLTLGDSVAVSGVCLTVEELSKQSFWVQASGATLARTRVGEWRRGDAVNLEPALRAGDFLGGHFVQGHVDGVGEILDVARDLESGTIEVTLPPAIAEVTVPQGSMAVDGVSLTVNHLAGAVARFAIIPYTWSHTTLSQLKNGNRVHVEADIIAKYVGKAMAPYLNPAGG